MILLALAILAGLALILAPAFITGAIVHLIARRFFDQ